MNLSWTELLNSLKVISCIDASGNSVEAYILKEDTDLNTAFTIHTLSFVYGMIKLEEDNYKKIEHDFREKIEQAKRLLPIKYKQKKRIQDHLDDLKLQLWYCIDEHKSRIERLKSLFESLYFNKSTIKDFNFLSNAFEWRFTFDFEDQISKDFLDYYKTVSREKIISGLLD